MTNEEYQKINDSIKNKLTKEDFAKISDDLGTLRINNDTLEKSNASKDERYSKLEDYKNQLLEVNSNLQRQIGRGTEDEVFETKKTLKKEIEERPKEVNLRKNFDKNGRFIQD